MRIGGATAFDDDVFSSLKDAPVFPSMMRKHQPVWPDGIEHGKLGEQGMFRAAAIRQEMDKPPADIAVERRKRDAVARQVLGRDQTVRLQIGAKRAHGDTGKLVSF